MTNPAAPNAARPPQSDNFLRYLATRHGSGLAGRADPAGNHQLSAQLIDQYATAGRIMEPGLASRVARLNAIMQQESLLAQTTPNARAALAGTGYDPLASRREVAALEQEIYAMSADARNMGANLEMQAAQLRLQQLEMQTQQMYATQGARTQAELAQLNNARLTADQQTTALETAARNAQIITHMRDAGIELRDAEDIFASNDPALMQAAFNTTSRSAAYEALRAMRTAQRTGDMEAIEQLGAAASLQAVQLASSYDAETLNAMLQDPNQRPPGTSDLAIQAALGEHASAMEGQQQYQAAIAQGITNQQELQQLALDSLRNDELLGALHAAIASAGGAMSLQQLAVATSGAGLNAIAADLLRATKNGQLPVTVTVAGQQMQLPAAAVLDAYSQRMERADATVATQIVQAQELQVMMREHQETERQINATEAMLSIPIPQELRMLMDRAMTDARLLATQATRAGTSPEMRQQLMTAYETQMANARGMLVDYARARGIPQAQLDDIREGRIMSQESYRGALVAAFGFNGQANTPIAQAARAYFESVGVTQQHVRDWIASGSEEFGTLGAGLLTTRVNHEGLAAAVENIGYQTLAVSALEELAQGEAFQMLPPAAREALDNAVDWRSAVSGGISPLEQLQRVYAGLRIVDEMMAQRDLEAVRNGSQPAPTYQRGRIISQFNEGLTNRMALTETLAPGGRVGRAETAILTEYVRARRGVETTYGENAPSYESLPGIAADIMMQGIRTEIAGTTLVPIAGVVRAISQDARSMLWRSDPDVASLVAGGDPQQLALVEQAMLSVFVRKAIDPAQDRSTIFGIPLPSFGSSALGPGTMRPMRTFSWSAATPEEVANELASMGHNQLADQIRGN